MYNRNKLEIPAVSQVRVVKIQQKKFTKELTTGSRGYIIYTYADKTAVYKILGLRKANEKLFDTFTNTTGQTGRLYAHLLVRVVK